VHRQLEVEHSLFDRQKKYADHLVQADAYNDIEEEIIARACIGGNVTIDQDGLEYAIQEQSFV
jgi:hypothetical protein